MTRTIRVGQWFQGPTGSGQGGWTAHRLQLAIGQPVTVSIRRPIPLDIDMHVVTAGDDWHLIDPDQPDEPVLIASAWDATYETTEPVSIEAAADARTRFPMHDDHPVPVCFSCGLESDAMRVHSGELSDGRWATDWTVPAWAVDPQGRVDQGALWAAIDCAQAWYAGNAGGRRHAVTVQLAVDVTSRLHADDTYALVAWNGTYAKEWDGRKRGAGGAVFASDGTCVATSSSFWIAI